MAATSHTFSPEIINRVCEDEWSHGNLTISGPRTSFRDGALRIIVIAESAIRKAEEQIKNVNSWLAQLCPF